MTSERGPDYTAGETLSRTLHDRAIVLTAIGQRIAEFDAGIAAALARRHAQALARAKTA